MHQKGGAIQRHEQPGTPPKARKGSHYDKAEVKLISPQTAKLEQLRQEESPGKIKGETRFRNNVGIAITKVRMNQPNRVHQWRYKTTYRRIGKYT